MPSPFERRSLQDELARCGRYFQKSHDLEDPPGTGDANGGVYTGGSAGTAGNSGMTPGATSVQLAPRMLKQPAVTVYAHDNADVGYGTLYGTADEHGTVAVEIRGQTGFSARASTNVNLRFQWTAEANIGR